MACLPHLRGATPNINAGVDSILRTIYQKRPDPSGNGGRRRIVFTSFSPDVCSALNWKQPNCKYLNNRHRSRADFCFSPLRCDLASDPVFFASLCGREASASPSPTVLAHVEAEDERSSSLESVVRFSKANNLLGVMIEGDILVNTHLTGSRLQFHIAHGFFFTFLSSCPNNAEYQS